MIQSPMPQDILKYEAKFALNLTARECICYGAGIALGLVGFFLIGNSLNLDTTLKIAICVVLCAPFIFFGKFKPFGIPLEKLLIPFVVDNILAPSVRLNETHYGEIEEETRANTKIRRARKMSKNEMKEKMATPSDTYVEIL